MNKINEKDLEKSKNIILKLNECYKNKMVGQDELRESILVCFFANGHILVESVPGLAKTTAAKIMANAIGGSISRIQCTPDLLPSDIIGTQIFNYKSNEFENKLGPVFSNIVILDEINRSSAKTGSAMLEAMQEKQVTIGGVEHKLPNPFITIATQNPIEQEGTYLLPEAQLDRFLLKEKLDYPNDVDEIEILNKIDNRVFDFFDEVISLEDIKFIQKLTKEVFVDDSIKKYIVDIVKITRKTNLDFSKYINLGASPRASIAFMECAKAKALLKGRDFVIPEDIKSLAYSVLRHRISLKYTAQIDDISIETIIDKVVEMVETP